MKTYEIRMMKEVPVDWTDLPRAEIDAYVWGGDYRPCAWAQVIFVEGDGFYAKLTCEEAAPTAVYKEHMDPVYEDSCLEFFACWDNTQGRYLNIEMNAGGASLSAVGEDRYTRTPTWTLTGTPFSVIPSVCPDHWSVTVHLPLSALAAIYGMDPSVFVEGYTFRGNFYKCGDRTLQPHYGMWNPVGTPEPDFHQPAYFGTLILKK